VLPRLYSELADWWPLLSAPEEYEEEAATYAGHLRSIGDAPARTVLELGSGGGNNALYLKRQFEMTLVDLAPGMLEQSRALNPECEHHLGDMRTIRLGRQFDRVFLHDAICYMASRDDLQQAAATAFIPCRPGGGALLVPDFVRETFQPSTSHGGSDGAGRSLRYLEWVWDPEPADSSVVADYVIALRTSGGELRTIHDRHIEGLFSTAEWIEVLSDAGFAAQAVTLRLEGVDDPLVAFTASRPG
jgi:SAM-dependent methyltransferase